MELLYSDKNIVVCLKPLGLDSEHQVPAALQEALGGDIYPIHRLDKNVAGVMVYARTKPAAAALSKAVQDRTLVKEYLALVHGIPEPEGSWEDLLFKDSRKNKVFVVKRQRSGVKKAELSYSRLTQEDPCLVRVRLHTGRSHQIRVQFASRGFPLVGDHKYGARDEEKAPMLFSCRLEFPYQGSTKSFEAMPDWPVCKNCTI